MIKAIYLISLTIILYSCSDNNVTNETNEPYVGDYKVQTMNVFESGTFVNKVNTGFYLELTLKLNGEFSGILVFGDGDLNEQKLSGTYVAEDENIKFISDQDTFLRDLEWKIEDSSIFSTSNSIQCILKKI